MTDKELTELSNRLARLRMDLKEKIEAGTYVRLHKAVEEMQLVLQSVQEELASKN